ncbi:MAG: alpha-amylase family glycosyl hydrolase, partial [Candidatus Coprenecus sp.]|nr:alpha-amylase family glycosyl hydrolase [Candidatus Coprenecus sp.]
MIYDSDTYLIPYKEQIDKRYRRAVTMKQEIAGYGRKLSSMMNNHLYYGLHYHGRKVVLREYAPNATAIWLIGDVNGWKCDPRYRLQPLGGGNWELVLPTMHFPHGTLFKLWVEWNGGAGERIPSYINRVVQDPVTKIFSAQAWRPRPYIWKHNFNKVITNPLIYEAHIGMSSEEEKVSTFEEFRIKVLPRIKDLGYNAIQLMALQEHPYYGSFGYQVSSFYALSSRFGTPEEFKLLVDDAHSMGIAVIMDLVHSHSVDNVAEGLSLFDGTDSLYFHSGPRGRHSAWQSRCFNYGKRETLSFLLSNV